MVTFKMLEDEEVFSPFLSSRALMQEEEEVFFSLTLLSGTHAGGGISLSSFSFPLFLTWKD